MTDKFIDQVNEVAKMNRRLGNSEFRIAAMRMFEKLGLPTAVLAVSQMEVDRYLTVEEISDREAISIK